jgi:hypothetical protein
MSFPAGAEPPVTDDINDSPVVHAIDGDGSSLCDSVEAGGLAQIDSFLWPDVPAGRRCADCQTRLRLYGAPDSFS